MKCRACKIEKPETEFFRATKAAYYDKICRLCKQARFRERVLRNKRTAIEAKGGKCQRCGYDKCIDAFDFHHVDVSQKEYEYNQIRNWHISKIMKELEKCLLLCRNCHAEVHYEVKFRPLTQRPEWLTLNQQVAGSTPAGSTKVLLKMGQ